MDCRKGLMRRNTSAGLVGTARWQGHAEQLEKPSSPRREIGGAGKPYNRQHREVGGRREGFGWVCSSEEAGNVCGAKRPAVCSGSNNKASRCISGEQMYRA